MLADRIEAAGRELVVEGLKMCAGLVELKRLLGELQAENARLRHQLREMVF